MTTKGLIIYCLILLFIILFIRSNRKTKASIGNYRRAIDDLKDRAQVDLEGLYSDSSIEIYPFLNDTCHAFLICRDREKDLMAVVTEEDTHVMSISTAKNCEVIKDSTEKKSFDSLICRITSEQLEEPLDIVFSSDKHKEKGYIGKALIEDAQFFRNKLLNLD